MTKRDLLAVPDEWLRIPVPIESVLRVLPIDAAPAPEFEIHKREMFLKDEENE